MYCPFPPSLYRPHSYFFETGSFGCLAENPGVWAPLPSVPEEDRFLEERCVLGGVAGRGAMGDFAGRMEALVPRHPDPPGPLPALSCSSVRGPAAS